MFQKFLATAVLAAALPLAIQAGPIQFNLVNVNFTGGGSAVGSIVYDPVSALLISSNVSTTPGGTFSSGTTYFFDGPTPTFYRGIALVSISTGVTTGTPFLYLNLGSPMSTDYAIAGGTISISAAAEGACSTPTCNGFGNPLYNPYRSGDGQLVSAGTVSAVPEPGTWLLGGLSLLIASQYRHKIRRQ